MIMNEYGSRDNRYDPYINSHECLVNPNSGFLTKYSHILRADIDTFPTPGIVGFWPDKVLANKYQGYTFRNSSGMSKITEALKEATSYLGSKHNGWHDIGSSWFGPSHKILKLSLMTVALSRYLRVYMFGPGTHCRCASCTALPQDCQWGSGPYAGTVLLYAQEIAMNLVWTQEEFDSMKTGYLDYGTTSNESVCGMLELHVFHNAEPFSKFSFGAGKYK
ncbi:uncharacterized protein LOC111715861 isoform X2 [Eurytemora carolleeae]|nr:uncharacterized protein LOC111715861 isoform X2 [Eurytemora carolleeae]|eukprot:XP_023347024.1 uncharacterized protein LOC111715861 isoform X2 [Eurytemora affinis]